MSRGPLERERQDRAVLVYGNLDTVARLHGELVVVKWKVAANKPLVGLAILVNITPGEQSQHSAVKRHGLDGVALHGVVGGLCHLLGCREVQPQLYAKQASCGWNGLLVLHTRAGAHPLHLARGHGVLEPHGVSVVHRAFAQVAYGLDAAVGVKWESCGVVIRVGAVKRVQHEEGVKVACGLVTQYAYEAHSGTVLRAVPLNDVGCMSEHGFLL